MVNRVFTMGGEIHDGHDARVECRRSILGSMEARSSRCTCVIGIEPNVEVHHVRCEMRLRC